MPLTVTYRVQGARPSCYPNRSLAPLSRRNVSSRASLAWTRRRALSWAYVSLRASSSAPTNACANSWIPRGQPAVGRQPFSDLDPPRHSVTRPVRAPGVTHAHAVADLAGEGDHGGKQALVAIAADLCDRRLQRHGLGGRRELGHLALGLSRDSTGRRHSV
jgi:hypothetical protein